MYRIAYGKLKPGKIHDFVGWFTNDEKLNKLKAALPAGVSFLGTKLVDMGDADHDFEFWYEIPNYAALDSMDTKNPTMKGLVTVIHKLAKLEQNYTL